MIWLVEWRKIIVLHVQHDYFSSLNQSNHWFVALSLTLPSSGLKLPNLRRISSFFFAFQWQGSQRFCLDWWWILPAHPPAQIRDADRSLTPQGEQPKLFPDGHPSSYKPPRLVGLIEPDCGSIRGGGGVLISHIPVFFLPDIPYPISSGYKYPGN